MNITELVAKIAVKMDEFKVESEKVDNKSAARRARKLSLEIEKLNKTYRKESVK